MSNESSKPASRPLNEGYRPVQKGWAPKVQGGFKPTGTVTTAPPSGGSGVSAAPNQTQNAKKG